MTQCTADGSWCCGQNNVTSCCDKNLGFQIASSIAPYATNAAASTVISTTTVISGFSTSQSIASQSTTSQLSTSQLPTSQSTSVPSSNNGNNSLELGLG